MKYSFTLSLLLFLSINLFSQEYQFQYRGQTKPGVTHEQILRARYIGEIMPGLWRNIGLPYQEKIELNLILNYFPDENYKTVVEIVSVEVEGLVEGEKKIIKAENEELSQAQKEMLNAVDLWSDISVRIYFRHKYAVSTARNEDVRIGYYSVRVVPKVEAIYPGGNEALTQYIQTRVVDKIINPKSLNDLPNFVDFVVDEEGKVINVEIIRQTPPAEIDALIQKAFAEMPKWSPAQNSTGVNIRQPFRIPFFGGGC